MSRVKFNSSVLLTLIFAGLLGAEGWLLMRERQLVNRATVAWKQKVAERDWLAKQSPALTLENEQAIAAELVDAIRTLAALRSKLQDVEAGWLNARPPAKPLDAFFDIAGFVERARATATQTKVGFAPSESFGFAAYSTEGPAAESIPRVYRQRLAAQRLIEALIEAHPVTLLGFQLEAPPSVGATGKSAVADYFSFNPALSLRQSGQLDTLAFRLEFNGQTATLRDFLNRIAGFPQPFVVRSVDVDWLPAPNSAASPKSGPLVRQNLSKFGVIVELVLPSAPPAQARQ